MFFCLNPSWQCLNPIMTEWWVPVKLSQNEQGVWIQDGSKWLNPTWQNFKMAAIIKLSQNELVKFFCVKWCQSSMAELAAFIRVKWEWMSLSQIELIWSSESEFQDAESKMVRIGSVEDGKFKPSSELWSELKMKWRWPYGWNSSGKFKMVAN